MCKPDGEGLLPGEPTSSAWRCPGFHGASSLTLAPARSGRRPTPPGLPPDDDHDRQRAKTARPPGTSSALFSSMRCSSSLQSGTIRSPKTSGLRRATVVLDTDMSRVAWTASSRQRARHTRSRRSPVRWVEPGSLYFVGGPPQSFDTQQRSAALPPPSNRAAIRSSPARSRWGLLPGVGRNGRSACPGGQGQLSGVLAANDKIACGIMHAAEDLKVGARSAPGDRLQRFSDLAPGPPATLDGLCPMAEMGAPVVRTLVRRIEQETTPTALRQTADQAADPRKQHSHPFLV